MRALAISPRGGACASLIVAALSLASAPTTAFGQQEGEGEAPSTSSDDDLGPRPATPPLSFRFLPFLKLCSGVSLYPTGQELARFDLDVAVGGRYELTHGPRARLELVPELGYTFHYGDLGEGGHYGFLGLGLRFGGVWVAASTVTALALGQRSGAFDLGVRAGLRLEVLLGFLGLELSWEYRTLGGEDLHGLRVLLLLDAAVVVMPMTLTRMGWAFRRRSGRR